MLTIHTNLNSSIIEDHIVDNVKSLGPYTANGDTVRTYTETVNTGDYTHLYISTAIASGKAYPYDVQPIEGEFYFEYPKLTMSINGVQKISADHYELYDNFKAIRYTFPKNSTITLTIKTKHSGDWYQGVDLINFLLY